MAKKHATPGIAAGLARHLSKQGFCSRSKAIALILAGEVTVNGVFVTHPGFRVKAGDRITVNGEPKQLTEMVYFAVNKPKGLITTERDERGRETVFSIFSGTPLPRLHAVGRLDKASEGLLLFTNNTLWSSGITAPGSAIKKEYHVQVGGPPDTAWMQHCTRGITEGGEVLTADSVTLLRSGGKTHWVMVVLTGGRNRQIRRMAAAGGKTVLRLVRVAIGPLRLGELKKGEFRMLSREEAAALYPLDY